MDFLNDFGVQPILLAAQAVNFLVLLWILKRFMYKPLLKVLADRRQTIADSLANAAKIEASLAKTEQERERKLAQAAKEAQQTIEEAGKSASQIIEEAHQKATADINQMLERNNEAMKLEREQLRQQVRADAANLVALALQKVTGKVLTQADQKKLVDQSVKNL